MCLDYVAPHSSASPSHGLPLNHPSHIFPRMLLSQISSPTQCSSLPPLSLSLTSPNSHGVPILPPSHRKSPPCPHPVSQNPSPPLCRFRFLSLYHTRILCNAALLLTLTSLPHDRARKTRRAMHRLGSRTCVQTSNPMTSPTRRRSMTAVCVCM